MLFSFLCREKKGIDRKRKKNVGSQTVSVTIDLWTNRQNKTNRYFMIIYAPEKKEKQVWNDMRVSKRWSIFIYLFILQWTIPLMVP